MIWVGMQMVANQTAVRQNLVRQELQEGTISPGQTLEGFVYCQLSEKQPKLNGGQVIISMIEASSGRNIDFAFVLNR